MPQGASSVNSLTDDGCCTLLLHQGQRGRFHTRNRPLTCVEPRGRTRPNPLTWEQARHLRGARPASPPPRPSAEPGPGPAPGQQHRGDHVVGQKIALGRIHQHQTVTVLVAQTTLAIEFDDGDTWVIGRTTTQPVRSIKGQRPRTATSNS
jgi:hypothetical protein